MILFCLSKYFEDNSPIINKAEEIIYIKKLDDDWIYSIPKETRFKFNDSRILDGIQGIDLNSNSYSITPGICISLFSNQIIVIENMSEGSNKGMGEDVIENLKGIQIVRGKTRKELSSDTAFIVVEYNGKKSYKITTNLNHYRNQILTILFFSFFSLCLVLGHVKYHWTNKELSQFWKFLFYIPLLFVVGFSFPNTNIAAKLFTMGFFLYPLFCFAFIKSKSRFEKKTKKNCKALQSEYRDDNLSEIGTFNHLCEIHLRVFGKKLKNSEVYNGICSKPNATLYAILAKYFKMNKETSKIRDRISLRIWLDEMLKVNQNKVVDWNNISKEEFIETIEKNSVAFFYRLIEEHLTDDLSEQNFCQQLDASYSYEGYELYRTKDL